MVSFIKHQLVNITSTRLLANLSAIDKFDCQVVVVFFFFTNVRFSVRYKLKRKDKFHSFSGVRGEGRTTKGRGVRNKRL